jgi:hypothetical protein
LNLKDRMFHVFNDQVFLESNIIRGMLICLAFPEQDVDAISGVQPCNISCVIYLVTGQERPCLSFFCIFFSGFPSLVGSVLLHNITSLWGTFLWFVYYTTLIPRER